MSFLRLHKLVIYGIAALGLVALSFGGELSPASLVALLVGYAGSTLSEAAVRHVRKWPARVTQMLLVLLAIQAARGFMSGAWLSLAMEFSGWLTVSRLANRRSGADYQQVVMLAFVQLIAATVLTSDLGFALLFIGYVVVTPWALSLSHLHSEIEQNYPAREDHLRGAEVSRVLASRRIVGGRFLGAMALLSVPTLLLTLALFLLFPRIGLGFIGLGKGHSESVAGFGDHIELGGFGVIRDDPTIVLRVSAGRELANDERLRALRLRGTSFDIYDGRRWTRSAGTSTRLEAVGDYYPVRRFPGAHDTTLRIALERIDEPVLFLPSASVGFRFPSRSTPQATFDDTSVSRGHGFDLRYQTRGDQGLVYEVVVGGLGSDRDVPESHDVEAEAIYLGVPEGHERVRALAESVRGALRAPLAVAKRFEQYLRDEGRFAYSLDQPDSRGKKPLEVFLFEARRGHCEYFATALVIMLRSVGIPARNVTGFAGGEYNSFGDYYGIRQGDAHSWAEVLVPERGWVTFDPTPATSAAFAPTRGVFASVGDAVDALRTYWALRVVGYDLRDQLRGARKVSAFFQKFSWFSRSDADPHTSSDALRSWFRARVPRGTWLAVAGGLLASVLVGSAIWRRVAARRRQLPVSVQRVQWLYARLLRELARRGHERHPHTTPGQFAAQVARADARAGEVTEAVTQLFERVRYGEDRASAAELHTLEVRLRALRRAA